VQRFMADELLRQWGAAASQARSILEVGCGTGYLTRELRRLNRKAQLLAVDLDVALIQEARRKVGGVRRTAWLVADGETITRGRFDLIISNSTFQWLSEPGKTLKGYAECLNPGGCLVFAAMGPKTFQELALSLKGAAQTSDPAHCPEIAAERFLGESDWRRLLTEAGLDEIFLRSELISFNFPSVKDFLASLQATGATNPTPRPLSPRLFQAMLAAYKEDFGINGSIPATYDLIWASARKRKF
jgi:malonyl-CoA O-methyltransferase